MADLQRKTANLFDDETASGYYNDSGVLVPDIKTSHSTTYIPVDGTTYTASGLWYSEDGISNFAVYEWDNDKNWLRRSNRQYPPSSNEITFTIRTDTAYITLQVQTEHGNIMLNLGSTALPYEPYWQHSLRKLTTATEAVENPLYSDGTAITAYTIKGNTVQNGTPTPSNPVDVQGVGVRTENLYSGDIKKGGWSATIGSVPTSNASNERLGTNEIFVIDNTKTYTIAVFPSTLKVAVMLLDSDNKMISDTGWSASNYRTISNTYGFVVSIKNLSGTAISLSDCEGIVLVEGSSVPTTYEPYGYKIPISNGQQSIDIYIGNLPLLKSLDGTAIDEISNGTLTRRVDSDGSVLPTPTTTQITMPSIPTTEGANSITVDTTVQPSEFTATWTGWHNANVKEWDGSQWNE